MKKPRVGIVGEILVKFLPAANNYLAELLESEGAEAVVPDLVDFMCYCFYNQNFKHEAAGLQERPRPLPGNAGVAAINWLRKALPQRNSKRAVTSRRRRTSPTWQRWLLPLYPWETRRVKAGSLTGEMMELIHNDATKNIVCTQPFRLPAQPYRGQGCDQGDPPGASGRQHRGHVDYDPGASEVNQLNRIKLMLSTAVKNLEKQIPRGRMLNGNLLPPAARSGLRFPLDTLSLDKQGRDDSDKSSLPVFYLKQIRDR